MEEGLAAFVLLFVGPHLLQFVASLEVYFAIVVLLTAVFSRGHHRQLPKCYLRYLPGRVGRQADVGPDHHRGSPRRDARSYRGWRGGWPATRGGAAASPTYALATGIGVLVLLLAGGLMRAPGRRCTRGGACSSGCCSGCGCPAWSSSRSDCCVWRGWPMRRADRPRRGGCGRAEHDGRTRAWRAGFVRSRSIQIQRILELRFSAMLGEEPTVELALVWRLRARALLTEARGRGVSKNRGLLGNPVDRGKAPLLFTG